MPDLEDVLQAQADSIDSIVSAFTNALSKMVDRATTNLSLNLAKDLKFNANGTVAATQRNLATLSKLDDRFQDLLNSEGYQDLLSKYVESFNGQFEWFNQVMGTINSDLVTPIPPVIFSKADLSQLNLQAITSKSLVISLVDKVAATAKQRAIQSVGGLNHRELSHVLAKTMGTTIGQAEGIAATSISTFYRTISDRGFEIIEEDLPNFEIRYNYNGPLDKLNRPFCLRMERLSRAGKTWTRTEIKKMNNGQGLPVLTTCGGNRCRHTWCISTKDLSKQQSTKSPGERKKQAVATKADVARDMSARKAVHSMAMQARLGAPHPVDQLLAAKAAAQGKVRQRRANV